MERLWFRSCSAEAITLPWGTGRVEFRASTYQNALKFSLFATFHFCRVFMDQHGDVEGNYTLVSAQSLTGGGVGLLPTGRFV